MNGAKINKREKRDTKSSSQIQGNHGRAEIRKVGAGFNVSIKRGNVAGTESLVFKPNLPTRETDSMANTKIDYKESTRLEDQRDGAELYSVRCYDCD